MQVLSPIPMNALTVARSSRIKANFRFTLFLVPRKEWIEMEVIPMGVNNISYDGVKTLMVQVSLERRERLSREREGLRRWNEVKENLEETKT